MAIKQVTTNDNSNAMIKVGTLNMNSGNDFFLTNLTAKQSSVALIGMNSIELSSNSSNKILFTDIVYKDSVFDFHQDLIKVDNIELEHSFDIIMSQIKMFNLTFTRNGYLLSLEHQTYSGLQLIDSNFYDISGGSIYLRSENKQNRSLTTKLLMMNITADRICEISSPFIITREGGELAIYDSTFTNSYNIEGGSIILSQDQNAVVLVYNCSFQNNSALYGGVADIQEQGLIKFYNSNLTNNFGVQAGLVQLSRDGYIEIYDCVLTNNYAISASVIEFFITSKESIISSSIISGNIVFNKETVLKEFEECNYL